MSARRGLFCSLLLLCATPAAAHRLDEYLQATMIAVEKGRVQAEIRLAPGVMVFPSVFAAIDRDADGTASEAEQRAYAERVLGDVSLGVDGRRLSLRLISWMFPPKALLEQGRGEIQVTFEADMPAPTVARRLSFENHHQRAISVYLVNGLVPRDSDIRLGTQQRSDDQSFYQLDYADRSAPPNESWFISLSGPWGWTDVISALLLLAAAAVAVFRRGGRVA
jgi:hypothetical protein